MLKNISKELIGYDEHFNNFVALNHKKKVPKVIMLTGKKGIGKSTLIFHFLCYLNNSNDYDLNKKNILNEDFIKNTYQNLNPNILYINCENQNERKIDFIRKIKSQISNSVIKGFSRFILIDDVELLNVNSSNALLKIIEEPSISNFFILINNNSQKILETIKSRCIEFKFFLNESSKNKIIDRIIEEERIKNNLQYKELDISPGNFLFFSKIFSNNDIDVNENIVSNTDLLLQKYRLTKTESFFNCAKYLIESHFFLLSKSNMAKVEFLNNLRSLIIHDLIKYKILNLNHKNFIDTLNIQLKNVG